MAVYILFKFVYLVVYILFICLLFIIPVIKTSVLTVVHPSIFVMVRLECCRKTETAIFAARTNLPVLDFKLGKSGAQFTVGNLFANNIYVNIFISARQRTTGKVNSAQPSKYRHGFEPYE